MSGVKSDGASEEVQGGKEPDPKGGKAESAMSRAGQAAAGH